MEEKDYGYWCYKCNKIKGDSLTYEEMIIAMEAILKYRKAGSCGS